MRVPRRASGRRSPSAALAASLAVVLCLSAVAGAQSDASTSDYEAAIASGLERYAAREWAAARAAFERAHAMKPGARTLRGLGLCAYYAGDYLSAARELELALRDDRHPLSSEQREQVRDLLARSYQHVGQVRVQALPAEAAIRIDQRAVASQERVLLLPGRHEIEVTHPLHEPHARAIEVTAGQDATLYVELSARREAAAPAPASAPAPSASELTASEGTPIAPWVAGGVTVAAGISAAVLALLTDGELSELQSRCDRAGCDDATRRRLWRDSPIESYETLTNAALIAAAAGAVTTVTLLVVLQPGEPHRAQPTASLGATRAGLGLTLAF